MIISFQAGEELQEAKGNTKMRKRRNQEGINTHAPLKEIYYMYLYTIVTIP